MLQTVKIYIHKFTVRRCPWVEITTNMTYISKLSSISHSQCGFFLQWAMVTTEIHTDQNAENN